MRRFPIFVSIFCLSLAATMVIVTHPGHSVAGTPKKEKSQMTIQLTSSAFVEGAPIPARYTCDGQDVSPPLKWSRVPPGTRSLALICDDPDAPVGTWVHWVLYNVPSSVGELPEGVETQEILPNGARQGINDFRHIGYGGPCPPEGSPHRYFFKIYALDTELALKPKATKKDLQKAMEGRVLAEGQWMGIYKRR